MTNEEIKRAILTMYKLLNDNRANAIAEAKDICALPGAKMKQKDKARFTELSSYIDGLDCGIEMITALIKEIVK